MEIFGKIIDWERLLSTARSEMRDLCNNYYISTHKESDFAQQVESIIWKHLLRDFSTQLETRPTAEQIVDELVKLGLDRNGISAKKNQYNFTLTNRYYKVHECKDGKGVGIISYLKWRTEKTFPCHTMSVKPEVIAALIYLYDSMAPKTDKFVAEMIEMYRGKVIKKRREKLARKIMDDTIRTLIDQYLAPLNISCKYYINGDSVRLEMETRKFASMTVPFVELPEKLSDSASIITSLQDDPFLDYFNSI